MSLPLSNRRQVRAIVWEHTGVDFEFLWNVEDPGGELDLVLLFFIIPCSDVLQTMGFRSGNHLAGPDGCGLSSSPPKSCN